MAFRLECTLAKCVVQNTYEKAVSSKANCKKGNYALSKAFSRCEEYCHELASIERVWPRAFT
eukprot:1128828-Pelagomonas_calceolata.AAC.1